MGAWGVGSGTGVCGGTAFFDVRYYYVLVNMVLLLLMTARLLLTVVLLSNPPKYSFYIKFDTSHLKYLDAIFISNFIT